MKGYMSSGWLRMEELGAGEVAVVIIKIPPVGGITLHVSVKKSLLLKFKSFLPCRKDIPCEHVAANDKRKEGNKS